MSRSVTRASRRLRTCTKSQENRYFQMGLEPTRRRLGISLTIKEMQESQGISHLALRATKRTNLHRSASGASLGRHPE